MILQWLRRYREAARLVEADADALARDHGDDAYDEARARERDVVLPDGSTHAGRPPEHWRRIAVLIARRTGRAIGLDTATRILADRDDHPPAPEIDDSELRAEVDRLLGK